MRSATDHNPFLATLRQPAADRDIGKGSIEPPADARNMPWQTRPAAPTEYENQLGDALERVFAGGASDLATVVAGLNDAGIRSADGRVWTTALFEAEMGRLGGRT